MSIITCKVCEHCEANDLLPKEQKGFMKKSLGALKKIKSVAYSSQGSHIDQLNYCNWLADGTTTGWSDYHYAPSSLIMSTFLIRSATSQSSSYPIVLTRLGGPRATPNPHLKFVEVPGIEAATSWSVVRCITFSILLK